MIASISVLFIVALHPQSNECDTAQFVACTAKQCVLNDLTASYQTALTLLSCSEQAIQQLPKSNQKDLLVQLKSSKSAVEQAYKETKSSIEQLKNQSESTKSRLTHAQVLTGKATIESTVTQLQRTIAHIQESLGYTKKTEDVQKEQAQKVQAAAAYQAIMINLVRDLKPVLVKYNTLFAQNYAIISDLYKAQKFEASFVPRVAKVTQEWQNIAKEFYDVYQKHKQTIAIDDITNYVVLSIRALIYFYVNLIEIQITKAQRLKKDDSYPLYSDVVTQLLGSGKGTDVQGTGYDTIIKNLINTYFQDNQAYLNKVYLQAKVNLTYNTYKSLLNGLIAKDVDPEKQLDYAESFYALIMSDNKVLPENQQAPDANAANSTIALLYVLSAQNQMKKMIIGKDTQPMRDAAIAYYKKAATYYQNAGDTTNVQNTVAAYTNLTQAVSLLSQAQAAQKSNNLKDALDLYTQAQTAFQSAGDIVDASSTSLIVLQVQGEYYLDQAKTVATALSQKATDYATAITNSSASTIVVDQNAAYTTLISKLNDAYKNIFQYYVSIVTGYQTQADQDSLSTPSQEVVNKVHLLNVSASVLQKVIEANILLVNGDASLNTGSIAQAQESYKSALILYTLADEIYAKNPQIVDYIPLYPSTLSADKTWSYVLAAQRHITKMFVELASKTTDPITAFHYYTNGQFRSHYLTTDMQQFLDDAIKKIMQQPEVVQDLIAAAQKAEKDALALSPDAWKPTISAGYSSPAENAWEQVIKFYSALYKNGESPVKTEYLKAIDEYATAYSNNVPAAFYPAIGTALIKYHTYVLLMLENDEKQVEAVSKSIDDLIMPFFDTLELLVAAVNNTSLITSSSDNQYKVLEWQQRFDQALMQQEDVLDEVAQTMTSEQRKLLLLLDKTTDALGAVTDTYLPAKRSITLPNPPLKLADLTKQLGDYYFQKKDYVKAYMGYSDAQTQYKNGNQYDKVVALQQQLDMAKTLYYGSLYRDSIIPQGSITLGSFSAPASYDLKLYKQVVPKIISDQFPSGTTIKAYSPEQVSQFTISVMIDLYLYWWIKEAFGVERYAQLIALMKPALEKDKNVVTAAVKNVLEDEDEQADCINIVMNAKQFRQELMDRVTQKKTSFSLQQTRAQDGSLEYVLYELHIPIPQFPIYQIDTQELYYKGYPSANLFYVWASRLFATGKDRIVVNGVSFMPGNQPDIYKDILDDILALYFSKASTYQIAIDAIKASDAYKKLKSINKNDMTVKIADYLDLFNGIRDNYQKMILYCDNALNESFIDRTSEKGKKINTFIANLCKSLGDELSAFLIGDPRSRDYHVTVLDAISNTYINAIINYGYDPNLYKSFAEYCKNGGDVLVKQSMYFVSSRLYVKSEKAYRSITPQTPDLTALANDVALTRLENVCKAATINIAQYLDARKNGLTIKNEDGTTRKVTLNQVIADYNATLAQAGGAEDVKGLDTGSLNALNAIKGNFLDGLIFYSGSVIGSKTPYVAGFGLLAQSFVATGDDKTSSAVIKDAQQMVGDYMQKNTIMFKNAISLDAVTTITFALQRTSFPDGKTITDVVQHGFDMFIQKSRQSVASNTQKATALQALSTWSSLLYTNFASLFINDFLGGIPANVEDLVGAINNLNTSIDTETNAMNSATWQFFDTES